MSNKKVLVKSIVFGKKGELAREAIEKIEKKVGKDNLSNEVRKAIIFYTYNKKEFRDSKIECFLKERKELKNKLPEISKQLQINEKELNKLGYKLKDLE